jgi:hypothetical protein
MRGQSSYLFIAAISLSLIGCTEREQLGSDYVLVTPVSWNPDGHPGTTLYRGSKVVWGNVYTGYFYLLSPTNYTSDGMFLFVGPVPFENGWYGYSQLYAVRGDGPPVVLSERLLEKRLAVFNLGNEDGDFAVHHLVLTNKVFRADFEYNSIVKTCFVSWDDIKRYLDEGDKSASVVTNRFNNYRRLP